MDGTVAINHNLEALRRILAGLIGMAGLAGGAAFTSPLRGGRRSSDRRVGVTEASQPPPDASRRPPLKGEVKSSFTLPRHLRLAILRLLRPAEAAARRLIIAAARGLAVTLPPPRKREARPATVEPQLRRFGIAIVMSPADHAAAAILPHSRGRGTTEGGGGGGPRTPSLPLLDPLKRPSRAHRRTVPAHAAPRILLPGLATPHRLPPPPSPDDPIDASRLALRLAALAAALDDLPGQAKRFARWKAARDAAGAQNQNRDAAGTQNQNHDATRKESTPGRRTAPLRPGRPPGGRLTRYDPSAYRDAAGAQGRTAPRRIREVDEILAHAHALAIYALRPPDTS
ncbi:hypothetical protein [Mesorhizobium sp. KR9-304]|uniref:hypothetical protein n=1 Tax=Mesorhizobium sp. KR9-304 TaxID=3156614 RepID=UPI0032B54243